MTDDFADLAGEGMSDAGIALLRRLKASGAPLVGADAYAFAQLLESDDLPRELRTRLCLILGYATTGGYPLARLKGETIDRRSVCNDRDTEETESSAQPAARRVRKSSAGTVGGEERKTFAESGGKKDFRPELGPSGRNITKMRGRTNNPNGRPMKCQDYDLLPPNKWVRVKTAAKLLDISPRALRHRIAGEKLPDNIQIGGWARCTLLRRVVRLRDL